PTGQRFGTQSLERRLDRGRVMREVVIDHDSVYRAAHLHAALHAFETGQRGDRPRRLDPAMARRGNRSKRVGLVMTAVVRPAYPAHGVLLPVTLDPAAVTPARAPAIGNIEAL